jgi:hypothetical protein
VVIGPFWLKTTPLHLFFILTFNLNKWFSYSFSFIYFLLYLWVRRRVRCCVGRLVTALCNFPSYCGVHLVHIQRSTLLNCIFNQWFEHQRWESGSMDISVTLTLSYYLQAICHFMLLTWMLWVCSPIHPFCF